MTQPSLAVFDLDGTLADTRHRLHHVATAPKDWTAFFAAAPADPPLPAGVTLALHWARDHELGYVTGRPERCRGATLSWLADHGLPEGPLWMRGDADRRPARVAKPGMLRKLAGERTVAVVVDDDERVCVAYEKAGFRVIRADWMPPAATLIHAQEREGRA